MKKIRIITAIALLASMVACNPIEDKSLRDDYITNAGTPVTSEELTSYLHVDQPYPNTETAVEETRSSPSRMIALRSEACGMSSLPW